MSDFSAEMTPKHLDWIEPWAVSGQVEQNRASCRGSLAIRSFGRVDPTLRSVARIMVAHLLLSSCHLFILQNFRVFT
jgi:hypothetical protein